MINHFSSYRNKSTYSLTTPYQPIRQEHIREEPESPCPVSPSSTDSSPVQRPPRLGPAHVTPSGKVLDFPKEMGRFT